MQKSINCLLFCFVSFWLFSCNQCDEKQSGYYKFTPQELQINPYYGHEVILFQNLSGDSLHFSAGDRISNMIQVYPNHEDECKGNYYWLETNNIVISSNSNSWQFSITLTSTPTATSNIYDKVIAFEASIPAQRKKTLSDANLLFERDTITGYMYNYTDLFFHTSLTLGLKSFTDVYEIKLFRSDGNVEYWVNKIYYTIKLGIVGFSTQQNDLWYLDK